MKKLEGIYVPLMTPFHEDGTLALELIPEMVDYLVESGVHGLYVGGSSAEGFLMSDEERIRVSAAVAKATDDRIGLIAHVGAISTDHTVAMGKAALDQGYQAISAVPPFYWGFSKDVIRTHYEYIADNVALPLLLYNIPGTTGVNFSSDELIAMMEHEQIIGVKHTTHDMVTVERLRTARPDSIIFHGADDMLTAGMLFGANGGIGTTNNLMPKTYVKLYELAKAGQFDEAFTLQKQVNQVTEKTVELGIYQAIKMLMKMKGVDFGYCRRPFLPLDQKAVAEVEMMFENLPG